MRHENKPEPPIFSLFNRPRTLVGGYDGRRSLLQPPIRSFDQAGWMNFEEIQAPDGSRIRRTYSISEAYFTEPTMDHESIEMPDGTLIDRFYEPNSRLGQEYIQYPDGSQSMKHWDELGDLAVDLTY